MQHQMTLFWSSTSTTVKCEKGPFHVLWRILQWMHNSDLFIFFSLTLVFIRWKFNSDQAHSDWPRCLQEGFAIQLSHWSVYNPGFVWVHLNGILTCQMFMFIYNWLWTRGVTNSYFGDCVYTLPRDVIFFIYF